MDSFADWIPASGQQISITTTLPPDIAPQRHGCKHSSNRHDGWRLQSSTPDLYPSPSTALTSSGRERVQIWTNSVGISPQSSTSKNSDVQAKWKLARKTPVVRKMSNIKPGQLQDTEMSAHQPLKMQANGLALPQKVVFDPWNACTTGHQRAENRLSGSTSWRQSRERKLKVQLADTSGSGGKRLYDTVGAGSENFGIDGRTENGGWEPGAPGLRKGGQQSIVDCFVAAVVRKSGASTEENGDVQNKAMPEESDRNRNSHTALSNSELTTLDGSCNNIKPTLNGSTTKIFQHTCIYINGSTYPLISDHLLRQLIVRHGGALSIALARRSVSHVILTHKVDSIVKAGQKTIAGGGLAAGKVRKELERKRDVGVGVKYVTAHWVIESIKAGKILPEGRFSDWRFVERGQEDMRGFFSVAKGSAHDSAGWKAA